MNFQEYLSYSNNKESNFYSKNDLKSSSLQEYVLPAFTSDSWITHTDKYWHYIINKKNDFPSQGWKIHISATPDESQNLLYDVARFLLANNISFKFVPSKTALLEKNQKYSDRSSSGKFITVYPKNEKTFCFLLKKLKEITSFYKLGPYILNDKQWQESNIYFRYGGLKSIERTIDGSTKLVIRKPDGEYVEDKRVPYYFLPDFVVEPLFVQNNNYFPKESEFRKINDLEVIKAIHFSNAGGVYIVKAKGTKMILKEGRPKAGIDANNRDGYARIRNEYSTLKILNSVTGVVDVFEYFTSWQHNYFTEELIEGQSLQNFIAKSYQYNSSTINNDKNKKYAKDCKEIIEQLKKTIEDIHSLGIAIGDLSLTNIIVMNDLTVKLIDFEAARSITSPFIPDIATPNFYSTEANNYEEADWFSFHRVVRELFLPITPVIDIAPTMSITHDKHIKRKFGFKISSYLQNLEQELHKKTKLFPGPPYIAKSLGIPNTELTKFNIEEYIQGLKMGLINNLDSKSIYLTKGDIAQYNDPLGNYNIANGAFGIMLALLRLESSSAIYLKESNAEWINLAVPYLQDISFKEGANFGLFNGLSGIITVLYELGFTSEAEKMLHNISFDNINDVSMYSGLSGMGMLLLSFYSKTKNKIYLKMAEQAYKKILSIYEDEFAAINDFGLLSGWSGVSLFLWKYSLIKSDYKSRKLATHLLDSSLTSLSKKNNIEKNVYVVDKDNGNNRFIPYIENGSSGLGLVLFEFIKDDKDVLNEDQQKIANELYLTNNMFCSYNGGLFSGYFGFLPLANAANILNKDSNQLNELLKSLNMYILKEQSGGFLVPGKNGYKCSMDVATGSAGLILILNDIAKKKKWGSWIPILDSDLRLFSKNN